MLKSFNILFLCIHVTVLHSVHTKRYFMNYNIRESPDVIWGHTYSTSTARSEGSKNPKSGLRRKSMPPK